MSDGKPESLVGRENPYTCQRCKTRGEMSIDELREAVSKLTAEMERP